MAKEKDPKPSHQLYLLQIKSTLSTKQIIYGIYKRLLRTPTHTKKKKTLALIAVDFGGKKTQE